VKKDIIDSAFIISLWFVGKVNKQGMRSVVAYSK